MKKSFFRSVLMATIVFAAVSTFSSCSKDDKKDVREDYVGSYRTNYEFTHDG